MAPGSTGMGRRGYGSKVNRTDWLLQKETEQTGQGTGSGPPPIVHNLIVICLYNGQVLPVGSSPVYILFSYVLMGFGQGIEARQVRSDGCVLT